MINWSRDKKRPSLCNKPTLEEIVLQTESICIASNLKHYPY